MTDKVLIVGLGSIGVRHSRNAVALGCEVTGFDPDPGRPTPDGVRRVETFYDGLLERPSACIIASPPEFHGYQWRLAVQEGVPVLVEKPMAVSVHDARLLADCARKAGIVVAVGHQLRALPSLRAIRAGLWAEDRMPYAAHAEFAYALEKWRPTPASYRAGILSEAIHELDLLAWMLGEPSHLLCEKRTMVLGHEKSEDLAVLLVRWPWGSVATIHLDMLAPEYRRRLVLYERDRISEWKYDREEGDAAYVAELSAFLAGRPLCTAEEGLASVLMLDAARRSTWSGTWEAVRS